MKDIIKILVLREDVLLSQLFNMTDEEFSNSENTLGKVFAANLIEMSYVEEGSSPSACFITMTGKRGIEKEVIRGSAVWVKINDKNIIKGEIEEVYSKLIDGVKEFSFLVKDFGNFGRAAFLEGEKVKSEKEIQDTVEITNEKKIDVDKVRKKEISSIGIIYRRYGKKKVTVGNENSEDRYEEMSFRHSTVAMAVLERARQMKQNIKGYFVEKSEADMNDKYFKNKPPIVQKANQGDYAFLVQLADELNWKFFIRNGWAFFVKPDYSVIPNFTFSQDSVWGQLLEFSPRTIRRSYVAKFYGDVDLEEKKSVGYTLVESKGC